MRSLFTPRFQTLLCAATIAAVAAMAGCGGSDSPTDPSSLLPAGSSTLTATINGTSFKAVATVAFHAPATPGLPNGTIAVSGNNKFVPPYTVLAFGVPAAVGTYDLNPAGGNPVPQNASVTEIVTAQTGAQWNAGATFGGSGSITLDTLTAAGASGHFAFTAVALTNTGATGQKTVTNGVFNVKF